MKVVANSSPLVHLSAVDRLGILKALFKEIIIPRQVYDEVVIAGKGKPGSKEVKKSKWIKVCDVSDPFALSAYRSRLGAGEAACIVLALEINADLVILDDKSARLEAELQGLQLTGTIGVLLAAAQKGLIDFQNVLLSLVNSGFYLSNHEYSRIIKLWESLGNR